MFRKEPSKAEVINDINSELVTLYRVVQNHPVELIRYFEWLLVSREQFERFRDSNPDTLTDIQRAARFYYLIKTCHGSRVHSPTFGVSTTGGPRLNLTRIQDDLSAAHHRLQHVTIERLPYQDFIRCYDRPHTLFYLDPPYYGCENYYGRGIFSREDFGTLAEQLAAIAGKFIMSINDTTEVRKIFERFEQRGVLTKYSVGGGGKQKAVTELLISNYTLPGV